MGVDYSTFLGPYVECKVSQTTTKKRTPLMRRTCPNPECGQYLRVFAEKNKFCPACGNKVAEVTVDKPADSVNPHELQQQIDERLVFPPNGALSDYMKKNGTHLWLPNQKFSDRKCHYDHKEETVEEIALERIMNDFEDFHGVFQNDLNVLAEAYGQDNILIKWGLINYAW